LNITFRQAGNPSHSVSQTLTLPPASTENPASSKSFQSPALCLKGGLCVVTGPFSGDSSKTFAAFEDRPATIVAETTGAAYIAVPELTGPGKRPLFVAEGTRVAALPIVVGELLLRNNHRELAAGQTLLMFPTLDGPSDLPDRVWQADAAAPDLAKARRLIQELQLGDVDLKQPERTEEPSEGRREDNLGKEGEILLVLKNVTPEQIFLRGSTNQALVFHLRDEAFRRGAFKYDLLVEARKAGKVEVKGYVIPLLAPIVGQEFAVKAAGE